VSRIFNMNTFNNEMKFQLLVNTNKIFNHLIIWGMERIYVYR